MIRAEQSHAAKVFAVTTLALGNVGLFAAQQTHADAAPYDPACDINADIANIASHVRDKTRLIHDALMPPDANESDVKAFPKHDPEGNRGLMWNPLVKVCGGKVVRLFEISQFPKYSIGVPHPIEGTKLFVDSVKPKKVLIQGFPGICSCEGVKETPPKPKPVTIHFERKQDSSDFRRHRWPGFTGPHGKRFGEQL